MSPERIAFHRLSDGLVYRFTRQAAGPPPAYLREDGAVRVVWSARWGWIVPGPAAEPVLSRPWDLLPPDQARDAPPEGLWVSKKGVKSYVYRLAHG